MSRVAIVTGAAQGIGRAIALRLSQEGLDVVVNDLPSNAAALEGLVAEISNQGRKSVAFFGDVSKEENVNNLVQTAVEKLGGLDVMVANAGIARTCPFISTSLEQFDLVQSVNVRSVFLAYKAAAIQMIKQGRGGRIIGFPEWSAYCASKFAIRGLTQVAAAEFEQYGITVNAYAPGIVNTDIFKDIDDNRTKQGLDKMALRPEWKVLSVEEIAGLVAYLVHDSARGITGQAINLNGGMVFD